MADLTPEELANIERLAREKNKEKQLRRMRALARAAEVGAYLSGQHDLAEGFGAAAEGAHAYGAGDGHRAGGMRKAGGNLAGSQASKFAQGKGLGRKIPGTNKVGKLSGGKSAALGGAVAGAIQGEGVGGIAKSAASWYFLYVAFAALFTLAGSIPALLYLNFHFIASKLGSKLFGEMTFLQKLGLLGADILAAVLLVLLIAIPLAVIYVGCNPLEVPGVLGKIAAGGVWAVIPSSVCEAFEGASNAVGTAIDRTTDIMCSTPQIIAEQNGTAYPFSQNSPQLVALMSCIESHQAVKGKDVGSRFTWEQNAPFCNYTRGNKLPSCGVNSCQHTVNSCHYGGHTGAQGAEAVDYGNEAIASELIQAAQSCGAGFWLNEGDHVHISTRACDGDGGDR